MTDGSMADGAMADGAMVSGAMDGSIHGAVQREALEQALGHVVDHAPAPAGLVVEDQCGEWLKALLGLPPAASFTLTSGGQMAHASCLAAARHALLARCGWDVELHGLSGAPAIEVLTSSAHHAAIERAARLLGMGSGHVRRLPVDDMCRLHPDTLDRALREGAQRPTIVVLSAGDPDSGAFDPFDTLIRVARRHDAWVHVDGACGLWMAASPLRCDLVRGVEYADSWTTDGQTWLNVPFDCGYAFIADAHTHWMHAPWTGLEWMPDSARRTRGFATYAALQQLGHLGVADLIERCCRHARDLVRGIGALEHAMVLWESRVNQGLVRFLDQRPDALPCDHDAMTDAVMTAVHVDGESLFSPTIWRGARAMRIRVCHWQTSDRDVRRIIAGVEGAIARCHAEAARSARTNATATRLP